MKIFDIADDITDTKVVIAVVNGGEFTAVSIAKDYLSTVVPKPEVVNT
jgi:hypothetical protein